MCLAKTAGSAPRNATSSSTTVPKRDAHERLVEQPHDAAIDPAIVEQVLETTAVISGGEIERQPAEHHDHPPPGSPRPIRHAHVPRGDEAQRKEHDDRGGDADSRDVKRGGHRSIGQNVADDERRPPPPAPWCRVVTSTSISSGHSVCSSSWRGTGCSRSSCGRTTAPTPPTRSASPRGSGW